MHACHMFSTFACHIARCKRNVVLFPYWVLRKSHQRLAHAEFNDTLLIRSRPPGVILYGRSALVLSNSEDTGLTNVALSSLLHAMPTKLQFFIAAGIIPSSIHSSLTCRSRQSNLGNSGSD